MTGSQFSFEILDEKLELALSGEPQIVIVSGAVGIGKTATIREFCNRIEDRIHDLVVAWGQCTLQRGELYPVVMKVLSELKGMTGHAESWLDQSSNPEQLVKIFLEVAAKFPIILVLDDVNSASGKGQAMLSDLVRSLKRGHRASVYLQAEAHAPRLHA